MPQPSASFSATLRVRLQDRPGAFAAVAQAIGGCGGSLDAIDLVRVLPGHKLRDITVLATDAEHVERITEAVAAVPGVTVERVSDRTFLLHLGGKIEVRSRVAIKTRDDLSMVYTPGVGRVTQAIARDSEAAWTLTSKGNSVAIVTDGSAVLGLGNTGPLSALPVMEGKAVLFRELAGINAWPLCLATTDPERIVQVVAAIAPSFGGINLEDIAAPRCFTVEQRLRELLPIPVFHDDQHGTATVVLAALLNALRVAGKRLEDVRIVIAGVGAAGTATARMLRAAGARQIIGCDPHGALHRGRTDLDEAGRALAEWTNPDQLTGATDAVLRGADVFVGLSAPGAASIAGVRTMQPGSIVFVLANPVPEIWPEELEGVAGIIATGGSDYPNQINNALAFPGVFRGALDCRATAISEGMQLAAARALAGTVPEAELAVDLVVPSIFNREVVGAVSRAVIEAAVAEGLGRATEAS
ncbi:MAG TPA: NAD-dependent malic enzyme [Candidatus Dormibacteraeota bacterium]